MKDLSVQDVVKLVGDIPTFPAVVTVLLRLLKNPESSLEDMASAISGDPGLCAFVLRLANSPLYRPGFSSPTTLSISKAVHWLGRKVLETAVLSYALRSMIRTSSLAEKLVWEHAVACGVTTSEVVRHMGSKNVETAYVCGLLHDVGKTIMCLRFRQRMHQILEAQYNNPPEEPPGASSVDVEKELLGVDHAQVGTVCLNVWQCGEEAAVACAYHHRPKDVQGRSVWPAVVRLSDLLCHKLEFGPIRRPHMDMCPILKALRLDAQAMNAFLSRLRKRIQDTLFLFS